MSFHTEMGNESGGYSSNEIDPGEIDDRDEIDRDEINRGETGLRIAITLLFFIIARLVEGLLFILVVFELGVTLITRREPSEAVRRVGNHLISYLVRIGRYITYNESEPPFPLQEFPEELDLTVPSRDGS
jgi:hypothetical protein